jgi:hypothetical protein
VTRTASLYSSLLLLLQCGSRFLFLTSAPQYAVRLNVLDEEETKQQRTRAQSAETQRQCLLASGGPRHEDASPSLRFGTTSRRLLSYTFQWVGPFAGVVAMLKGTVGIEATFSTRPVAFTHERICNLNTRWRSLPGQPRQALGSSELPLLGVYKIINYLAKYTDYSSAFNCNREGML